ncbi:MAG: ribbon-helix-helix protein, CopG family [Pelotomaculum sp.]|nr:ribbon-helix-helix protein, CopG family [Pelotomaculum sp.]
MGDVVSARVPTELAAALRAEAKRRGITVGGLVALALERYLERAGPEKEIVDLRREARAALILAANALAGGDKEKAIALRRAALELAERELDKECTPG